MKKVKIGYYFLFNKQDYIFDRFFPKRLGMFRLYDAVWRQMNNQWKI